jgi:hypothetical protein
MKKDRLDELLKHALSSDVEIRDVGQKGFQRFSRSLAAGAGAATCLDSMLQAALGQEGVAESTPVADAGLRRLRERLEGQRVMRRAPALRPALSLATLAAIAIIIVALQLLPRIGPTTSTRTGGPGGGIFAGAIKTRADIIAQIPMFSAQSEPVTAPHVSQDAMFTAGSRRLGKLDTFSTKVRGESFARRIDGNRRSIIASLSQDNGGGLGKQSNGIAPGDVSPAPTRHEILLNEKLDRVTKGF